MGECCDICGDIGVAEAILTCRQCNRNQEHMYCMRVLIQKAPTEGWLCEECEPQAPQVPNNHLRAQSKVTRPVEFETAEECEPQAPQVPNNHLRAQSKVTRPVEFETAASSSGRSGHRSWERGVKTGKTKYIPAEEAILLSGSSGNHLPSLTRPKTGPSRFNRTPVKPKTSPMKSFPQSSSASGSSQQLKPKKVSFALDPVKPSQQSRNLSDLRRSASNVVPAQAHCVNTQKERPVQVKSPQTNAGVPVRNRSSVAQPSVASGGNGWTRMDRTSKNAVLPDLERSSYTPASDVVWKGSFNILDGAKHRKLNPEILAYPPSTVLEKVYHFSKRMPQLLGFDVVSCDTIWPKLFPDHYPDTRDIALYLFPRHHQRSEDYLFLLENITKQSSALRVQIADVELLVFSSKLLPPNCQRWEGNLFLWGVFHRLKNNASLAKTRGGALPIRRPDNTKYHRSQDDEGSDMEIDMIAGVAIGRKDVVKHPS